MKKILFVFLIIFPFLCWSQKSNTGDSQNNNIKFVFVSENTNLTIDQCKEALSLFYEAYSKKMVIPSDVFDPMKLLVRRSYSQHSSELSKKFIEQFEILAGVKDGGPSSYGADSDWRLGERLSEESNRFFIDYSIVINEFKQSMQIQYAPECNECKLLVSKYFQAFKSTSSLPSSEFNELKIQVQRCNDQRRDECSNKTFDELRVLTGEIDGGPSSYGNDSKWRIQKPTPLRHKIEIDNSKTFPNGDILINYQGKKGVMDKNGFIFIKPYYDRIAFLNYQTNPIFVVRLNKQVGVLSSGGRHLIPLEYESIDGFKDKSNNFLSYKKNGKSGIISDGFNKFSEPKFDLIEFEDTWISFVEQGKIGFLDNDGSIKISPKYDSVGKEFGMLFPSSKVLPVKLQGKVGLVDKNNDEIVNPIYDQIGYSGDNQNKPVKVGLLPIYLNGKMGYIDEFGKILIEPKYDLINGFGLNGFGLEKVSFVKLANKWGLFDNNSLKEITPLKYDEIYGFSDKYLSAGIRIGQKYGLLSIDGKELLPANYDQVSNYWEIGIARIILNGLAGLINTNGQVIIEPHFHSLELLKSGLFMSKLNNKFGLISNNGQELIIPKYDEIFPLEDGYAPFKLANKWGILNSNWVEAIPPKYDSPFNFINGIADVSLAGKSFKIDTGDAIIINKFSKSTFDDLEYGGENVRVLLEKMLADLYNDIYAKAATNALLNKKSVNSQRLINENIITAKNKVEEILGGPMTKSQLIEFNVINKNAKDQALNSLGVLAAAFKEDKNRSSNITSSKGNNSIFAATCNWCGKTFNHNGFGYRIINESGRRKVEVQKTLGGSMGAFNVVKNNFDTYECARNAGYKELNGY